MGNILTELWKKKKKKLRKSVPEENIANKTPVTTFTQKTPDSKRPSPKKEKETEKNANMVKTNIYL